MDSVTLMFGQVSVEVDLEVQILPEMDNIHKNEIDHESEQDGKEDMILTFKMNPLAKEFYPHKSFKLNPQAKEFYPHEAIFKLNPLAEEFYPNKTFMLTMMGKEFYVGETIFKLNPFAEEFYPNESYYSLDSYHNQLLANSLYLANAQPFFPRNYQRDRNMLETTGRRTLSLRFKNYDKLTRTIYVSQLDPIVTEDQLIEFFRQNCGEVTQCRICTKQRSHLQFAFVEFRERESAEIALSFNGTLLGSTKFKVVPSFTSIAPLDPALLPKSKEEMNICARTIFCSNIDKKISQIALKEFFETSYGEVTRMRLFGDVSHPSRIAFMEFAQAESATMALTCNGMFLGSLPIRVMASKTQVQMKEYCSI